jgi:hypothetical protein
MNSSPVSAASPPPALTPRPLAWWRRGLIGLMRGFYFRRVRVLGMDADAPSAGGRLFLISHRNGAIDGYTALVACPAMQFMLSAQLLRHVFLRLMFTGLPVVRERDRARYGMKRSAFDNPIDAACAWLRAGGALGIFPEGYSEWGPHPLPYQAGGARIVRRLLEEGVAVRVIPLGLFYREPAQFRSGVEVLAGAPVVLPAREEGEHRRVWEKRIDRALGAALDAVSVNCPDMETFEQVERLAAAEIEQETGGQEMASPSYALAFKRWEEKARLAPGTLPASCARQRKPARWRWPFIGVFYVLLAPVLLAGAYLGGKADGKNTVSFFRFIGGLAAALIWLPVLLALFFCFPVYLSVAALLAYMGWRMM